MRILIATVLLVLVACGEVPPEKLEMQKCANHLRLEATRAGEYVSYDRARLACVEFIQENPFTKPWDEEEET